MIRTFGQQGSISSIDSTAQWINLDRENLQGAAHQETNTALGNDPMRRPSSVVDPRPSSVAVWMVRPLERPPQNFLFDAKVQDRSAEESLSFSKLLIIHY